MLSIIEAPTLDGGRQLAVMTDEGWLLVSCSRYGPTEARLIDELPPADWAEPDPDTADELARMAVDVVEGVADCDFDTLTEGAGVVGLADYVRGFELL